MKRALQLINKVSFGNVAILMNWRFRQGNWRNSDSERKEIYKQEEPIAGAWTLVESSENKRNFVILFFLFFNV